ncbi:MAG: hypothetical protein ACFFDS_10380 [Candidatus Thorarchaeota archaeon]
MGEVKFKKIKMDEEIFREKKRFLTACEINHSTMENNIAELEEQLDLDLPTRLLDDDIKKLEDQIKRKVGMNAYGNEIEATDADIDMMKIVLKKYKKEKKLGLPKKKLRLEIMKLKDAQEMPDAPAKQIKLLKKEIREKAYEIIDNSSKPTMTD